MTTALAGDSYEHFEITELVHDPRSPLAAIESAAMAVLGMGVADHAVRRLVDLVAAEARAAQELVDTALDDIKRLDVFPVAPLVHAVAARASIRWKGEVQVQDHAPAAHIAGSPQQFLRAVGNLVDNAFQHGDSDTVVVALETQGDEVAIRVSGGEAASQRVTSGGTAFGQRLIASPA